MSEVVGKKVEVGEKITREELLSELAEVLAGPDIESGHVYADELLLAYIGDAEVAEAYNRIPKWYA